MNMQRKLHLFYLLLISHFGFAQTAEEFNQNIKQATKFFGEQKYQEAIPHFEAAFKYTDNLNLKTYNTAQYRRRAADCYESVGQINLAEKQYHLLLQDIEADKEHGKKSLAYAEMLRRMGYFYTRQKKYDLALKCLDESISLYQQLSPQNFLLALAFRQKAKVAWLQKDATKAQKYAQEALAVVEKISPLDTLHQEVFRKEIKNYQDKKFNPNLINYSLTHNETSKNRIRQAFRMFKPQKIAEASIYFEEYLYAMVLLFEKKPDDLNSSIVLMKVSYDYTAELDKINALDALVKTIREKEVESKKLYNELLNASVAYTNGDYQQAILLFEKVIPNSKEYFAGKDRDFATVLTMLAVAYERQNMLEKAEKTFLDAQKLLINTEYIEDYAGVIKGLGLVYKGQGKYALSEKYLLESIKLYKKSNSKDLAGYAATISSLGSVYYATDRDHKAEQYFLEAKEIALSLQGGKESQRYASALSNLAYLYTKQGKYLLAEEYFRTAIQIQEKLVGKEHPEYAKALFNLAYLYHTMGFYEEAEYFYLEAKKIDKAKLGELHPQYLSTMTSLATLYVDMGNTERCLEYYGKTMELYLQTENYLFNENLAAFLMSSGQFYLFAVRDLAVAKKSLDLAKKIYTNLKTAKSADYAKCLVFEADILIQEEKYAEAQKKLSEAMTIEKSLKTAANLSEIQENLAFCYTQQKDFSKAYAIYKDLLKKNFNFIQNTFPALSEQEKEAFYEANNNLFANLQNFFAAYYPQNKTIAGDFYDLQLSTKALLLNNSSQMRERIMSSGDKDLQALYQDWKDKKNFLNKIYLMNEEEKKNANLNEAELEKELNEIERQLSQKSQVFANMHQEKQLTWKDVQKVLQPNEAAIEIIRILRLNNKKTDTIYVALVVKKTSTQPEWISIENGNSLENDDVAFFNNCIRSRKTDKESYQVFWKPIQDKLQGIQKIYLSPDGVYNQISINALWNPQTEKYLLEELQIQLLSNTKDLVVSSWVQKKSNPNNRGVLLGYPNYQLNFNQTKSTGSQKKPEIENIQKSKQRFFENGEISSLPGTKIEVESISQILVNKRFVLEKFLENEATEDVLKKIQNPRILHIATHGFFMENAEKSLQTTIRKKQNPLLRSGLLLAGASNGIMKKYNTNGEDGILTAYEAMTLNLYQTELVVASACETGLGDIKNGEGVYGLQRAFKIAGARNVLMSLWKVDDTATQELMTTFYKKWADNPDAQKAFKEAQIELKAKYMHPYYWAAFVMVGE
jgi:CHAT domain-containing protein